MFVVFRNFPLPELGHANAFPAAKAARCAGQQAPEWFWQLHDWLYENQAVWSNAQDAAGQFRSQAISFGAEGSRYDDCLKDPQTEAAIRNDLREGTAYGVGGTPAFVLGRVDESGKTVDGSPLAGARPYADFVRAIDALLGKS